MTLAAQQIRLSIRIKMMDAESLILTYLSNNDLHPRIWIEPGLPRGLTPLPRSQRNPLSAKDIHYIVGNSIVNQQRFASDRSNVRNANISEL